MSHKSRMYITRMYISGSVAVYIAAAATQAFGQAAPAPPPVFETVDANGVDLPSGRISVSLGSVQIGAGGPGSLRYGFDVDLPTGPSGRSYIGTNASSGSTTNVVIDGVTTPFTQTGTFGSATYVQKQGLPVTLAYDPGTGTFSFTSNDGTISNFKSQTGSVTSAFWIRSTKYRNGAIVRFYYNDFTNTPSGSATSVNTLLTGITSSLGYQLHVNNSQLSGYWFPSSAVAFNMAQEVCDPYAVTCNLVGTWPTVTRNFTNSVYTDATGRSVQLTSDAGSSYYKLSYGSGRQITYNGSTVTLNGQSYFKVAGYTDGRGSWRYQYPSPYSLTTLAFDPNGGAPNQFQFNSIGQPATFVSRNGNSQSVTRQWTYDGNGRPISYQIFNTVASSIKRSIYYSYDARGNLTQENGISSDSSQANVTTVAHYPGSCVDSGICNKPDYTIDALGRQTDFTYDTASGEVASVTLPAPITGGVRPQRRYSYIGLAANFRDVTGNLTTGDPVYMLAQLSQCRTNASCNGTSDETRSTYGYSAANALALSTVTAGAGDGSVSSTSTMTYTPVGDVQTVDGPLPGSSDTTRFYYDAMRRKIGEIGPDPDGAGPLKNRATRITYAPDGQVATVETGTAPGQGDSDLGNMSLLQSTSNNYDLQGRIATISRGANGTNYALVQQTFDNAGLLQCRTLRMDPNAYGSLPASACTAGNAGSFGADRITQYAYDVQFRLTSVTSGVGTPDVSTDQNTVYTPIGDVGSISDANNNSTTYTYDGFGRLVRTTYPDGSYEQLTLDAEGKTTARLLRDGQSISYTYDALDRLVAKDVPNSVPSEYDVAYTYDLLGELTRAQNSAGHFAVFSYDALGHKTVEQSNWTTRSWQYDAAGRRVRLDWGDGLFVTYDYLTTGEMQTIRENGSLALAIFGYDDLGRRTSLTRGNGTVTSYAFDAISRLTSLNQDLAGTAQDLNLTYSYNPAGQVTSRGTSNDAYSYSSALNTNRAYASNGLNQYTQTGGIVPTYDARGNLTSAGSITYGYTSENQLATTSDGYLMTYDPLGRFHWIAPSATVGTQPVTWMQYDGSNVIEELTGGAPTVSRRYVFGPHADEPLVWYEGAGTNDRRYLHADERGSIIAITNDAGNAIAINAYDDYGIPNIDDQGSNRNLGRFQFTGQAWFTQLGMYYYKARMYSPTLGRFLQPDPIGYGDGMNWYNYVGSDPVNGTDPTGLGACAPDGGASKVGGAANPCSADGQSYTTSSDVLVTGQRAPVDFFKNSDARFGLAPLIPSIISDNALNATPQSPKPITCATVLPNGRTVGSYVASAIDQTLANTGPGSGATSALDFIDQVGSRGPIDFKLNFKGQANAAFLGEAGNFAYGAVASGVGLSQGVAEFGAGAYALKNGKLNINNPFGEDNSAAKQLPRGYATNGCRGL